MFLLMREGLTRSVMEEGRKGVMENTLEKNDVRKHEGQT